MLHKQKDCGIITLDIIGAVLETIKYGRLELIIEDGKVTQLVKRENLKPENFNNWISGMFVAEQAATQG